MEQLKNELNKIEDHQRRTLIRTRLGAKYTFEKCSEAVLLEQLEFLKTCSTLELQTRVPVPEPAPHTDGLPEHLRPMVEDAMNDRLERRSYWLRGYTGGMVNEPNGFVLEWYKTFLQNHSEDSLSWLEAMYQALRPATVTWENVKALAVPT